MNDNTFLLEPYNITCIGAARRRCVVCIEKEVGVTGNREVVDGESVEVFRRLDLSRRGTCTAKLRKTIRNEENEDDQEAITGSFDLKVPEERVGAEEVQGFINDVALLVTR
jgi:hypothetical protein